MGSSEIGLVTPCFCIALDDSSERVLQEISQLHHQRGEHAKNISEFLRFSLAQTDFFPINDSLPQDPTGNSPSNRSDVFAALVDGKEKVKSLLDGKIIELMDHSRQIQAGFEGQKDVPFNIFLLADGKDMLAGGLLIPIMLLVLDTISKRDSFKLHVLLNAAAFPETDQDKHPDLFVYSLIEELKELTNSESEYLNKMCEALKIDPPRLETTSLYLFHNQKMGAGEVSDNETMEGMIGNSLLHLLSGNSAQQFAQKSARSGRSLPLIGMGTALVAYDPKALQEYCSLKKSLEIIDTLLLGEGLAGAASAEASRLKSSLGDSERWTRELFSPLPDPISQVIFDPETNDYKVVLKEIKLEKIQYVDFQSLGWLAEIEDSEQGIVKRIVEVSAEKIGANAARLKKNWSSEITQFAISLPQQRQLYPGGIDTAKQSLVALISQLMDELKNSEERRKEVEKGRKKPDDRLKKVRNKIKLIIENIPDKPKFIAKIPEEYQELAAAIYYHVVYLIPILRLRMLKKEYQQRIQEITGIDVQLIAADTIREMVEKTCGSEGVIDGWLTKIKGLKDHLLFVRAEFEDAFKQSAIIADSGWMEYFRVAMMNQDIADKVYLDHQRPTDYTATELIGKANLFADWQETVEPIQSRLSDYAMKLFKDLWQLDLQDLKRMYEELKKTEDNPLNQQGLRRLLDISQPLLRPNFSITSDHGVQRAGYFLKKDDDWQDFYVPNNLSESQNWETVQTNDSYMLAASQVLHNVNFLLLEDLFSDQKKKYLALPEKERAIFSTVSHRDFVTTLSETDSEIVRQYQWSFSPKGSRKTYTYSIKLAIDLPRYRKFAAEARVRDIKQYKIYAQKDMPELTRLVLEFQKIFADVQWSTYNKAFCVLKFVQNAITYKGDEETKGFREWPRYPIETLVEGVGDCEDVAILCASILVRLGFEVALLDYPDRSHMAFGVCGSSDMVGNYVYQQETGKKYYYGEATNDGWLLGEIPKSYLTSSPEFIKVELLVKEEEVGE